MTYTILSAIAIIFVGIIGGIASGATGALAGIATVGAIAGTGYLIQVSLREADKHRPKG